MNTKQVSIPLRYLILVITILSLVITRLYNDNKVKDTVIYKTNKKVRQCDSTILEVYKGIVAHYELKTENTLLKKIDSL